MSGTLYLVPTPIGNLGDISPRMAEALAQADFIAAEDTRVSVKLLNHLGLKKPMVSYYRHNTQTSGPAVLNRLLAGESCALVTDAGTPAISDPGEELVALCAQAGVTVVSIPGPCALVTALAASFLPRAIRRILRRKKLGMVTLTMLQDGKRRILAGMVDSGNGLYEPCTGLPVIVAYLPDLAGQAQVPIPVATVQGKQVLFGFRPQQLQANGTALEAWIALSPTPLQDVDALIPPGALPITTGE